LLLFTKYLEKKHYYRTDDKILRQDLILHLYKFFMSITGKHKNINFAYFLPGLPHIYFLFTVQLTNERVEVFLARRSVQHLVSNMAKWLLRYIARSFCHYKKPTATHSYINQLLFYTNTVLDWSIGV
jgi:hypothetical protein